MKMKKILPLIFGFSFISFVIFAAIMTWHIVTIQQIEYVSNDSLILGKDWSSRIGDSVQFTCRVLAPPQVSIYGTYHSLLRGANSWTCYAQDTANGVFGGIVIRQATRFTNTFLQNVDTGNIITVKGTVQEFWSTSYLWPDRSRSGWLTQVQLDTSGPITINSLGGQRPTPKLCNISDFNIGDYLNGGSINYLGGEKYEGMYVEIRNVAVGSGLANRQPFSIVDAFGNKMYVRDYSNFFYGSGGPSPPDTVFHFTVPAQGTIVNYIRGVIINGNNEGVFGNQLPYVIVPIYPNDLSLGGIPPQLSLPLKSPGVPTLTDSVQVSVSVTSTTTITGVSVYYKLNGGAFVNKSMVNIAGNIFTTKITPAPLNTLVEYYFSASNSAGLTRLLPSDTSISKLFYVVKSNDSLSIQDVQYCPNNGGHSGYEGAYVRGIEGIVTADTTDFFNYSCSTCNGGPVTAPQRVIIQNGQGPFSAIWITGSPTDVLLKGQKLRVRGTVTYSYGMITIAVATTGDVQILSTGNPLPAPQILNATVLANSKYGGDTTIKKWESVLVRINTPVWITCINAAQGIACTTQEPLQDTTFRRNFGEFLVKDNTNGVARVMLPGAHLTYTNNWDGITSGKTLLTKNDSITFMQGVLYYAYSNYKICPRTNADFGTVIPVGIGNNELVVTNFQLYQNFPNPFNPVTNIKFSIPEISSVKIVVYDILGKEVHVVANKQFSAGSYILSVDGKNLASGIYFYRMIAISGSGKMYTDTKKMVLIK
jgi:hypothetical protein